ncbi:MAG: hydantoinase B/oxoprolinase family protein [Steroidobacteraceae bacterium]
MALPVDKVEINSIDLEILRRKLVAVAGEMGLQLRKTAQSVEINSELDYATAIVDRSGAVVATDNPLQLGTLSGTARAVVNHFRFNMRPGDVVVTNAPEYGGTRAVDLAVIAPLFVGNSAVLYFVIRARMPDLGGMYVGGFNPEATEFFAEGVPVTPLKLYREGRESRDVMTTLLLNSRFPDTFRLTLDSLIAAMRTGEKRVRDLIGGYGADALRAALNHAQAYVAKRIRAEMRGWAVGSYSAESALVRAPSGDVVHVRADVIVSEDSIRIDFSRSDPQAACFVNSTLSNTMGFAATAVLAEFGEDVPANDGLFQVISVTCDPGRVTSSTSGGAVGFSAAHCGAEILESVSRALRVARSAIHGDLSTPRMLLSCRPGDDRRCRVSLETWVIGGASASAGLDGWNRPALLSRSILPSVEEWERAWPVSVRKLEFVTDTAGAGRWRGAPATEAVLRTPDSHLITLWWQGPVSQTHGTAGGDAGASPRLDWDDAANSGAESTLIVDGPMPANLLRVVGAGGAGFGPAISRDPTSVLADVLDGIVSIEAAAEQYGVVLSSKGRAVDAKATARRRAAKGG